MDRLIKMGTIAVICISLYLIYYHLMPAAGALFSYILPALTPFIFAAVVAVLIDPAVEFINKKLKVPRGLSALAVILAFFGAISGVLVLITAKLIYELQRLAKNMPDLNEFFTKIFNEAEYFYYSIDLKPEILGQIQQTISNAAGTLTNFAYSLINGTINLLTALPSVFIMVIIAIIATFFFSRDKEIIEKFFLSLVPEKWRSRVNGIYKDITKAMIGYIGAVITLVSITAVITITGLSVLGVEYAVTMGLITGFVDILPVLGPGMVFVPWIIITLVGGGYKFAAGLAVLYVIIVVQRQIMEPKLVADKIDVHPLATLAAIFIGLKLLGAWGVILGPVILVAGKAIKKTV
ncbi:MAG: sporulation integral membrane protein YtvI [Dehalobacterium sp.]